MYIDIDFTLNCYRYVFFVARWKMKIPEFRNNPFFSFPFEICSYVKFGRRIISDDRIYRSEIIKRVFGT